MSLVAGTFQAMPVRSPFSAIDLASGPRALRSQAFYSSREGCREASYVHPPMSWLPL